MSMGDFTILHVMSLVFYLDRCECRTQLIKSVIHGEFDHVDEWVIGINTNITCGTSYRS